MSTTTISISIVSHGQMHLVRRLMQSVVEVSQEDCRFQIILTENLKPSLVNKDVFDGMQVDWIINEKPLGLAQNQNQAFRAARGDYFCILNPDVVLVEPIFGKLIDHIAQGSGDIVAPLVVDSHRIPLDSFRDLPTPMELVRRRLFYQARIIRPERLASPLHPDWIAGTILLMPREVFEALQGMNERYFLYFEDVDFCSRARLAGMKLLVDPTVRIVHEPRRASKTDLRYLRRHLQSALRFFTSPVYQTVRHLEKHPKNR